MPFPPTLSRLVLRSPNGARIELDANEATIKMFGNNGQLLALLDASLEFLGQSIFVQQVFDWTGALVAQFGGLVIKVIGTDGVAALSAGSSGVPQTAPRVELTPTGATLPAIMQAELDANNGAFLQILSPADAAYTQAEITLHAADDDSATEVEINAANIRLNGKLMGFQAVSHSAAVNHAGFVTNTMTPITGGGSFAFVKTNDFTRIDMSFDSNAFTNTLNTGVGFGLRFTHDVSAVVTDFEIQSHILSNTAERYPISGRQIPATSNIAFGPYTVVPIWRRIVTFGAGTLTNDNKPFTCVCIEVPEA